MKKFFKIFVGIIIILFLVTYIPQFLHICTDCESAFVGSGYEPNIIYDVINSGKGILCKECAEKQHAITLGLGKSLDDYKKTVELNPLTVVQQWLD